MAKIAMSMNRKEKWKQTESVGNVEKIMKIIH